MDMVGKVIGNRYEIIEKIGTGGMATVYKARCRVLNRYVAVKVLKDEFANDSEFIKRFQVEAQSAASLSHQNIVSIFDVGNDNGMHYIVMELIEGKTLKEVINDNGKLPWKDAVKIAAQIASGLNQAHKNHIIHRDIKPHNIIITKEGVAKVTDFGIAKAVSNSTINAFGSTIGSVHYFSPEHARGGYTDEKSDIYSLGVVLYEMCTGKLPFDAETPVSVALKHMQETPEAPINLNNDIPQALNDVILKAMQKEVSLRYASAQAMYDDLKLVLKNPDDVSLRDVNVNRTEFPTQRIPIIGNDTTKEENKRIEDVKKYNKEQDDDNMSRKKGLTKSQALVRALFFLLIAVAVFFACFKGGIALSEWIFGADTTVSVPSVIGYSKEEAQSVLEQSGLKMEIIANVVSSEYASGYIVDQTYNEGYRVNKGETVGVKVSKGQDKVLVPNVLELSSTTAAKIKIETVGLKYVEAYEYSASGDSGDMVRQEPEVNTEVDKGSEVIVYISMGPGSGDISGDTGLIKVPSVLGKTEDEARTILNDANLLVRVEYATDNSKEAGIVLNQSPVAETYRAELSEIVVVVNKLSSNNTSNGDNNSESSNNNNDNNDVGTKKRILTIDLSNCGERSTFNVKVVVESNLTGKRVEYEAEHTRDDGKIQVPVTDVSGAWLKVYIDDVVEYEMTL